MAMYGALAGLGQALTEIGMTKYKSTLANKLEAEREAAAEQREIAREERQERRLRSKPDPAQTTYMEKDGALFKQLRNAYGDILDETLASTDEIEKRNYTKQKQKYDLDIQELNLENKGLANKIAQSKAANADKLGALDRAIKESIIRKNDSQGEAAIIRANRPSGSGGSKTGSSNEASISEYANLLKKEAKDVFEQYAEEDDTLTPTQMNKIARAAVEQAVTYGTDPQAALEDILSRRAVILKNKLKTK